MSSNPSTNPGGRPPAKILTDHFKQLEKLDNKSTPDVINIVIRDTEFWPAMDQLIKTAKPLVNMIGNCETRDASLASCMLELIRAARKISQLTLDGGDHTGFWMHTKQVFNRRFHAINTNHHALALFLHPMCRVLAISQAANRRNFGFMVTTALSIAKQWKWDEAEAKNLVHDLKEYQKCTGVFAGGQADALEWWETRPITAKQRPLKAMAIILHSVVPHAADVERYFSGLGGTQSIKRCNLTVDTFEGLSKLRSSYAHHLYKMDRAAGKSTHRKHAHMHTQAQPGIDLEVADDLTRNFTWVPPLTMNSEGLDDELAGPEAITDEELVNAFENLDRQQDAETKLSGVLDPQIALDGQEILEGEIYSWDELEVVNKGVAPKGFVEEISVLDKAADGQWDVNALLSSEGITNAT